MTRHPDVKHSIRHEQISTQMLTKIIQDSITYQNIHRGVPSVCTRTHLYVRVFVHRSMNNIGKQSNYNILSLLQCRKMIP